MTNETYIAELDAKLDDFLARSIAVKNELKLQGSPKTTIDLIRTMSTDAVLALRNYKSFVEVKNRGNGDALVNAHAAYWLNEFNDIVNPKS